MAQNAMDELVPIKKSLSDLYPPDALPHEEERWANLRSVFKSRHGHDPAFFARSPGRVNLLGEHIDYCLYGCVATGIAADIVLAVSTSPVEDSSLATITISNINPEKFEARTFSLDSKTSVTIDKSTHEWSNYFKAGLHGALSLLSTTRPDISPVNMHVVCDGTVPVGGGLSSSAAFVCASALAVLFANGSQAVIKHSLVDLAIVSERFAGVMSGGLDQASSVCSTLGNFLQLSFHPKLDASPIPIPKTEPPITLIIAESFVESNKYVTAPVCYNLRVVEVTLAAEYIAAELGLSLSQDAGPLGTSLRGLQETYFASKHAPSNELDEQDRLKHMLTLVEKYLPDSDGYDREQIAKKMNISVKELEERYTTKFPVRAERFLLKQRAQHVFSDASRVLEFCALLRSYEAPPSGDSSALLEKMGDLLNKAQDSCSNVCENSCPEVDEMCRIARRAGSYGSRITGAGWGGCSVHLVPKDKVDVITKAWHDEYYSKRFPEMDKKKLAQAVVVSEPGQGSMM